MKTNQRAYRRRLPVGNIYATLGHDYEKVGKLIDLRRGGLAFEYFSNEHKQTELFRVNIFTVGDVFNLQNLSCKVVYDIPISPAHEGIQSLKHSRNRRCGVKFTNLPETDNTQLEMFLVSHTKSGIEK